MFVGQAPTPDAVADAYLAAVAVNAALSGQFDARIKELIDARTAFESAQKIRVTLDEATEIREGAHREAKRLLDEADENRNAAVAREMAARKMEADLNARAASLDLHSAELDTRTQLTDRNARSLDARIANENAGLEERERRLVKLENEFAAKSDAFDKRVERFEASLRAA